MRDLIKRTNVPLSADAIGRAAIPPVVEEAAAEFIAPLIPAASKGPRTCLIVDDSRVVRRVSRQIVEKLGYQVIEAENGQEALARCKTAMPDLILLDWDMPVMTGIEFIAALRAIPTDAPPKAVFCTSKSDSHDIARGIGAGADEYVFKPFTEDSLLAKLNKIGAA